MNIAVFNNKGGVGKTTISSALAYVAKEKGIRTNVIDADKQMNLMQLVSNGKWDGGEIYEDGFLTAYCSLDGINRDRLCIIDCPPEYDFIEKLEGIRIDLWIVPIKGRWSIDGFANIYHQLQNSNRADEKIVVVSNMNNKQGKYGRTQFTEAKKLGSELYPHPIYRNITFEKAEDSLKYVFDMPYAMRCEAVQQLHQFAEDMING